jgi:2-C-methyl-D-erythritol 4-phosphate cytidylyltransferase
MSQLEASEQRVVAVVLGAGQGTRMGRQINKILLPLHGKPIILYALESFERCPSVDEVILVAAVGEEEHLLQLALQAGCNKVRRVIRGGASRHASEQCALDALRADIEDGRVEIILIHDGARPFVAVEKVERLIMKAREVGGAILATPLQAEERLVQVDGQNEVQRGFEGEAAWKAQTPQAFQAYVLLKAYDQAQRSSFYGTDTAAAVELSGGHIAIVAGDMNNLKITTSHDLLLAERLMASALP